MLNKRIKSVLVAGLLILGMGFAKVDSYAAEVEITQPATVNAGYSEPVYAYNENGIKVLIVDISGMPDTTKDDPNVNRFPDNTYDISVEWDTTKVTVNSANVVTIGSAGEISKEIKDLTINGNRASLRLHVPIEFGIHAINLDYDLVGEQLTIEEQIIKNYIDQMNATNIGTRDEVTQTRTIGKEYAISKDDWDAHIEKIKALDGLEVVSDIGNNQYSGRYEIRSKFSNKLIEIIEIEFFDATESKGWIPEITPGTGQALAVGGIVIGAAAAVGLLVNNRKRKDEE